MITEALLLASAYWVDIDSKRALVCDINHIQTCLKQLDVNDLNHLPSKIDRYREMMGLRHAMVIPIPSRKTAGLILINEQEKPKEAFAIVRNIPLKLILKDQQKVSLWHEQGHLINLSLPQKFQPKTRYQHEWLADLYLLWKSVQQTKNTELAWQQLHRRNLDIINDPVNLNHWSSPYLLQVLQHYSLQQILNFKDYRSFIQTIYPKLELLHKDEQTEIYNLIRFLFDDNSTRDLPKYLYWRRPKLASYLKPTFYHLVGEKQGRVLMKKLNLPLNLKKAVGRIKT